jgi:hypothetical protein
MSLSIVLLLLGLNQPICAMSGRGGGDAAHVEVASLDCCVTDVDGCGAGTDSDSVCRVDVECLRAHKQRSEVAAPASALPIPAPGNTVIRNSPSSMTELSTGIIPDCPIAVRMRAPRSAVIMNVPAVTCIAGNSARSWSAHPALIATDGGNGIVGELRI